MPFKHFAECFILKHFVSEPGRTLGCGCFLHLKECLPPGGRGTATAVEGAFVYD